MQPQTRHIIIAIVFGLLLLIIASLAPGATPAPQLPLVAESAP